MSNACDDHGTRVSRATQQLPPFSISQVTTLTASFADDLRAYAGAGVDGIGVWELKLGEGSDEQAREQLAASGLGSATAVPAVPSVLPLPLLPGPEDPEQRIASLCASVHRLAGFAPDAVLCFTGPAGDRDPDEARGIAVDGLGTLAREAESAGVRLALEPFQRQGVEDWSLISSLGEAAELIEEIGSDVLGIQFDVWHLWNSDVLEELPRYAHLIAGVHVNDWREPTRGWADRVLPGEGAADLPAILGVLEDVGWKGFYDLEIFSDNGAFGNTYPDSLWDLDAAELARRGRESFTHCWSNRRVTAAAVDRRGET
jgi:sugar phosphate isomerase/epimerase